jgi:hypothetical protein
MGRSPIHAGDAAGGGRIQRAAAPGRATCSGSPAGADVGAGPPGAQRGQHTVNDVASTVDATSMVAPWARTISATM